jgi:hypothetical protein
LNKRAIKSVLQKKHNSFVNSIKNEKVRDLVDKHSIITGGCIASMLLGEKINDFDYYFDSRNVALEVTKYYVEEFNRIRGAEIAELREKDNGRISIFISSDGIAEEDYGDEDEDLPAEDNTKQDYRPIFLTSNAITLSNKIQLVIRFFGSPEEIHENYDFVHCTNYWYSKTGELVLNQAALESLLSKELYYVGSKYPLCSLIRTRKFIKRGWNINAGQYLKMAMQLNELDLRDVETLEEQLIGVDITYFQMLIEALNERKEKNKDFAYDSGYIATIVDRIF